MQSACTPERHHGHLGGIHPPLHGDFAQCLLHGGIDHRHHPGGIHASGIKGGSGRLGIKHPQSRQRRSRGNATQHHVGIGHGGFGTTQPVTGRPRHRPGRPGSHHQGTPGINAGYRSPTGTDGVHIKRGQPHRQSIHRTFGRRSRDPVHDQAHVGGCAAHVERDGGGDVVGRRNCSCGPHPTGWPRQQQTGGNVGGTASIGQSTS